MVSMNLQSYFSNPFTFSVMEADSEVSISDFALDYGFSSAAFLYNAGVIVASLVLNMCLIPVICALSKCPRHSVAKYFGQMLQGYKWRNLTMHFIEAYLDLCIAAMLQLRAVSFI